MESPAPPAIAHLTLKANLLLALMLSLLLGFVAYVMYARGVFEATQELVLITDDAEGIIVGMDLSFAGFPIGRVRRTELGSDGQARIVLDIPLKNAARLRSSSVFTLERSMVGNTQIRAFSGVPTDPPLPDKAERSVLRGDAASEIPRLVASARALLENMENMTSANSSLNTSLAELQRLSSRLSGRYGLLTAALGSEHNAKKVIDTLDHSNALLAQTGTLLAKTDARVFGANGVMDAGQAAVAQLNSLLGDTRASLKKVDAVLAEAQAVGANARVATADLGILRAEVDASLRKVTQLVDEINRKWPFARDAEIRLP